MTVAAYAIATGSSLHFPLIGRPHREHSVKTQTFQRLKLVNTGTFVNFDIGFRHFQSLVWLPQPLLRVVNPAMHCALECRTGLLEYTIYCPYQFTKYLLTLMPVISNVIVMTRQ